MVNVLDPEDKFCLQQNNITILNVVDLEFNRASKGVHQDGLLQLNLHCILYTQRKIPALM